MAYSLEQSRDTWVNAYYLGRIEVLKKYEHQKLKVYFRESGITETQLNRYARIHHAVQNGVWKPIKHEIMIKEYEYNNQNTNCQIFLKSKSGTLIVEEFWVFDNGWKILEMNV